MTYHPYSVAVELPSLSKKAMGVNFDDVAPPTQSCVGGVLRQIWRRWQDARIALWTVNAVHFSYRIPFHHLPSTTWEPMEFPSCSSVTSWRSEHAIETYWSLSLTLHSKLLHVEEAPGRWRPIIDPLPLNLLSLSKFRVESIVTPLASIRKGDMCFPYI